MTAQAQGCDPGQIDAAKTELGQIVAADDGFDLLLADSVLMRLEPGGP